MGDILFEVVSKIYNVPDGSSFVDESASNQCASFALDVSGEHGLASPPSNPSLGPVKFLTTDIDGLSVALPVATSTCLFSVSDRRTRKRSAPIITTNPISSVDFLPPRNSLENVSETSDMSNLQLNSSLCKFSSSLDQPDSTSNSLFVPQPSICGPQNPSQLQYPSPVQDVQPQSFSDPVRQILLPPIGSSNLSLASHAQNSTPHRLSGKRFGGWYYSLAPSYKSKLDQFRRIFRGTPVDTDRLLVDYSCALSKNNHGLLLQGRMYVTENWICFYSKILYEQKIYLAVREIISITKEKTARVIPNAIQVLYSKNRQRFFFTSFASRERTFAILRKVWENCRNHQSLLQSSQTMSINEIVQQVREIYGDDSLAMLDDEDTDVSPDLAQTTSPSQVGLVSETSDVNLNGMVPVDEWPTSPGADYSATQSALGSTDDDEFKEDGLQYRRSNVECSVVTQEVVERNSQDSTNPYRASELPCVAESVTEETGHQMPTTLSVSRVTIKSDRRKRSKRRHTRGPPQIPTNSIPLTRHISPTYYPEDDQDGSVEAVHCLPGHDHPGQLYINTLIPLSVDALFACIFTDSVFFDRLSKSRGTYNMVQSSWPPMTWSSCEPDTVDQTENIERTIGYTLTLKQKLGPRTCAAVEQQTLLVSESRPGRCYVVDARVTNQAVPLCNCFCVVSRYCLLRADRLTSRLCVSSRVVYEKPVFFGAKSIIENTCRSGLTDFFTALTAQLTEMASELKDEDRYTGGLLSARSGSVAGTNNSGKPEPGEQDDDHESRREMPSIAQSTVETNNGSVSRSVPVTSSSSSPIHKVSKKPRWTPKPTAARLAMTNQSKAASDPSSLFLRSDQAWLFLVVISLLLCVCLSLVYNRLTALEQLAEQLSMACPGSSCSKPSADSFSWSPSAKPSSPGASYARLQSMKDLTQTMSNTLSQMQRVLLKVQENVDLLDRLYTASGGQSRFASQSPPAAVSDSTAKIPLTGVSSS